MHFTKTQIEQLYREYHEIQIKYSNLILKCGNFLISLSNKKAQEYLQHGFMRRFKTLKRGIENVYSIYPPERSDFLEGEEREDLIINLQAHIFNIFGCMDNLAWIIVLEHDIKIPRGEVGFLKNKINEQLEHVLPERLKECLKTDKHMKWKEYLLDYRHALAHRIPLYVPPKMLPPEQQKRYKELDIRMKDALSEGNIEEYERLEGEQDNLGYSCPVIMHSFSEKAEPICFHSQVLADFNTVVNIANMVLTFD